MELGDAKRRERMAPAQREEVRHARHGGRKARLYWTARRSPIPDSATFHWNSANAGRASALALQLPMPYATLDLILRTAIFTLAMAAAAAVFVRSKRGVPAGLSAIAIGGIGAFAVSSAPAALDQYGPVVLLFDAWCIATPAVIWILAQSLFRENFRPGPAHWFLAGIITIVTFAADWVASGSAFSARRRELPKRFSLPAEGPLWSSSSPRATPRSRTGALTWSNPGAVARGVFVTIIVVVFATLAVSDFVFGPRAPAPHGSCPLIWYSSRSPSRFCYSLRAAGWTNCSRYRSHCHESYPLSIRRPAISRAAASPAIVRARSRRHSPIE